jgi:anthranilate phosphoribosyltransferase
MRQRGLRCGLIVGDSAPRGQAARRWLRRVRRERGGRDASRFRCGLRALWGDRAPATTAGVNEHLRACIRKLAAGQDLTGGEASAAMDAFISGDFSPVQLGCVMMGLRCKGETPEELEGLLRPYARRVRRVTVPSDLLPVVDLCGTGGDGPSARVFNVSTTAMFVAAGAGVRVVKHGTSAVSSECGSTDVLKALGVRISADPATIVRCLRAAGVTYIHGPHMNEAMSNVIAPRRESGMRSFFNLLGPMANPASPSRQVMGVYDPRYTEVVARASAQLGREHVLVVCADDGLDELSISTRTKICELKHGTVHSYTIEPEDLGLVRVPLAELSGGGPSENAALLASIVSGQVRGARRDVAALNAAAAIMVSGLCDSLEEGLRRAYHSIDSGAASAALERLRAFGAGEEGREP